MCGVGGGIFIKKYQTDRTLTTLLFGKLATKTSICYVLSVAIAACIFNFTDFNNIKTSIIDYSIIQNQNIFEIKHSLKKTTFFDSSFKSTRTWFDGLGPSSYKFIEFLNIYHLSQVQKNVTESENQPTVSIFKFFINDTSNFGLKNRSNLDLRPSSYYVGRFGLGVNPHNFVNNMAMLSGIYFDPSNLKKNTLQSNFINKKNNIGKASFNSSRDWLYSNNLERSTNSKREDYKYLQILAELSNKTAENFQYNHSFDKFGSLLGLTLGGQTKQIDLFSNIAELWLNKKINNSYKQKQNKYLNFLIRLKNNSTISTRNKTNPKITNPGSFINMGVVPAYTKIGHKVTKINYFDVWNGKVAYSTFNRKLKKYEYLLNKTNNLQVRAKKAERFIKNYQSINTSPPRSFPIFKKHAIGNQNYLNSIFLNFKTASLIYNSNFGHISWGSKNKRSVLSHWSGVLPWFEHSSKDELWTDTSSSQMLNQTILNSEFRESENSSLSVWGANFDTEAQKPNKQRILKKKKTTYLLNKSKKRGRKKLMWKFKRMARLRGKKARFKSKIWQIGLSWGFQKNYEDLYKHINKNNNSYFFEKKLYLNRLGSTQKNKPLLDSRQLSKFGTLGVGNTMLGITSPQSQEFGIVTAKGWGVNFGVEKKSESAISFFKINLNKVKLFSFKEGTLDSKVSTNLGTLNKQNKVQLNTSAVDQIAGSVGGLGTNFREYFEHTDNSFQGLNYATGGQFFYKSKVFWNTSKNPKAYSSYYEFKKKETVSDRFLKTFKNIIKKRDSSIGQSVNRLYRYHNNSKLIRGLLLGNKRLSPLTENFNSEVWQFSSDIKNKIVGNYSGKIILNEDFEPFSSSVRSGTKKPHTVYGLLWDEYLKGTYGFNLNFLNLNNKIPKSAERIKTLENSRLLSSSFQKNLEKVLNVSDKFTGLSLDTSLANEITTQYLADSGFIKEISVFKNTDFAVDSGYRDSQKLIKKLKLTNTDKALGQKNKIKKYYKSSVLKNTINKNRLLKKSIKLIKKYAETPTGFKYYDTDVGINLPYIKSGFWIKNLTELESMRTVETKKWQQIKNSQQNILNRAYTTKLASSEYVSDSLGTVNKKKYGKKLIRTYGTLGGTILLGGDYVNIKNLSENAKGSLKKYFFFDRRDDFASKNNIKNKIKRDFNRIRSKKNKEIQKRFGILKKTTTSLFTKNRNKKFNNFKLFFSSNLKFNDIVGGYLTSKYGGPSKLSEASFFQNIYKIRLFKNFDNLNIYNNWQIKQVRSLEFKMSAENKKNRLSNYKNFKKITNSGIYDTWGVSGIIKNNRIDINTAENTMNLLNRNTKKISKSYKLSNLDRVNVTGRHGAFSDSIFSPTRIEIIQDIGIAKKNMAMFNLYDSNFEDLFTGKLTKKKNFSGNNDTLSNIPYTNSFIFKNIRNKNKIKKHLDKKFIFFLSHELGPKYWLRIVTKNVNKQVLIKKCAENKLKLIKTRRLKITLPTAIAIKIITPLIIFITILITKTLSFF